MSWSVGLRAVKSAPIAEIVSIMVTNPRADHHYLVETVNGKHTLFRCFDVQGALARTKIKEYAAIPENDEIIGDVCFLN